MARTAEISNRLAKTNIREGVILFREGGKFKWARKFPHCQKCGLVKFRHKGRGICAACYDKKRDQKPERKLKRKEAVNLFYKKNKNDPIFLEKKRKAFSKYYKTEKARSTRERKAERLKHNEQFKQKRREYSSKYRARRTPERIELDLINQKKWYQKNKEKILDRQSFLRSLKKNKGIEVVINRVRLRSPFRRIKKADATDFFIWRKKVIENFKFIKLNA